MIEMVHMIRKRVASLFIAAVLVLSCMPVLASAKLTPDVLKYTA